MSKRSNFTEAHALLILHMVGNKDKPISDFLKRSDEEQARLFDRKLSKCDGKNKVSKHQLGLAVDIYFLTQDEKGLVDWKDIPKKGEYYHQFWETLGGAPVLLDDEGKPWDVGHFEWR